MGRKYLAVDIETAKDVPGSDFKWKPHRPLGISRIAFQSTDGDRGGGAAVAVAGYVMDVRPTVPARRGGRGWTNGKPRSLDVGRALTPCLPSKFIGETD